MSTIISKSKIWTVAEYHPDFQGSQFQEKFNRCFSMLFSVSLNCHCILNCFHITRNSVINKIYLQIVFKGNLRVPKQVHNIKTQKVDNLRKSVHKKELFERVGYEFKYVYN